MFVHLGLRLLTKLGAHSRETRCERGGSCLGYENQSIDYTNVDTDEEAEKQGDRSTGEGTG